MRKMSNLINGLLKMHKMARLSAEGIDDFDGDTQRVLYWFLSGMCHE